MNAGMGKNLSSGMKEASAAAKELSYHLNQAYNTSTGNLDLSKLNASLQKSSTNVTQLSNKLLQAGASGQSAFINLAQAISKADYPMFKLNSRLTEMWTTLKNTARWQLSSSMLHGFMGAVQKATSYARDLDESLNNIRIVTGQSADKMDEFAAKANRAAKALSTTTTAYTNAALIFYQQGLDDRAVEERTNITIKMAQAAGENATEVSSYLTAIWNNFNNEIESGSRSLESFGDSMARLGAETAASSAEIAAGLEKFASIGETIGLSFDYASAAVTTIVDKTRQSADTVGTALKTIFARLQGLQLGETLEDGVDLNKYSDALEKVGVNVLDLNGNLRAADDIIYDLGLKWDSLSRAQQTALAQTVAGTRQYAQLMSLMNNFDDFLENVDISKNAEGTLTEQAEIFADSWEGAKKRVQAAAEGIYDSLINKDLMKDYNNVLADILTSVENLIDGMGGLGGVISAVGTFALSFISHKIQPAIQGLILNVQNLFTSTQTQARQLVSGVQTKNVEQINSGKYDPEQVQQLRNANVLTEARARLTVASKQLTQQES
jgi:TP901 family phage tail tape measure protein